MSTAVLSPKPASQRDMRLDVFRGLCLVMIFINHVPGNLLEGYTNRNFGFSDAAEAFVFMSGVAAGLAYSKHFRSETLDFLQGLTRLWKRAWTLYLVHILCTFSAIAIACFVSLYWGNSEVMFDNVMRWVWKLPRETMLGLVIMTHQFGYVNILPLYLVLLATSPLSFYVACRKPWLLVVASVAVWAAAGQWRIDLPNYPMQGGWFFNPFSWQLIFNIGMLTGVQYKAGKRLVKRTWWLIGPALVWLVLAGLVTKFQVVSKPFGHTMWLAKEYLHLPWFITSFDKTYVTAPRLLHILTLAYVVTSFKFIRTAAESVFAAPFALLGRQALPVFALGSVLCIGMQGLKYVYGDGWTVDLTLLGIGLALQWALAAAKQYWPKPKKFA